MRYAQVALNAPVRKLFTYHIPDELAGRLAPGSLVRVEFGVAMQPAVALAFCDETDIPSTKPIIELLDPEPVISEAYLDLARWLSESCLAPIGACIWLMLPPGFTGVSDRLYRFARDELEADQPQQLILPGAETKSDVSLPSLLLDYLRDKGDKRLRQLKGAFPKQPVEPALAELESAGMIASEAVLAPPSARIKTVKRLYPNYAPEDIAKVAGKLGRSVKHADLLEAIAERDEDAMGVQDALRAVGARNRAPLNKLVNEGLVFIEETERGEQDLIILEAAPERIETALATWRGATVYAQVMREIAEMPEPPTVPDALQETGASRLRINKLIESGALELREERVWRDSLRDYDFVPDSAPKLTTDQQKAWDEILPALRRETPARFLLHGVTGSGKTEIYLRAIAEALKQGRSAVLLVPEIALTPQTVRRVSERFPGLVALVHGSLPIGERYDAWARARAGELSVIVGTRSALFTPLPKLGLIVLDEEHDASYKQSPWMIEPHYHARDAAEYLAERQGAALILGSATPDLATWHRARRGHFDYLRLPERIMGHRRRIHQQANRLGVEARYEDAAAEAVTIPLPPVSVVDMRAELRAGNTSMFSRELQQSLATVLERDEQAMLLLNRRGQATYVFCRDCGYALECARCDTPMTYHRVERSLRCHHCGERRAPPETCPACGSSRIRFFGAGTQQVDQVLKDLFPAARTLRWDVDTARSPKMHFEILEQFIKREADALIGTQMIAKGLDLPLVTLVGVVSADIGLALPDYRAGERVFQLLTQVAGRAGRGVLGGKVVLQTYQPEHYVIQAAADHDYTGFAARESEYRRELGYPPYRRLARIVFSYTNQERAREQAEFAAGRLRQILQERDLSGTAIIGPVPCFYSRVDRNYRWHLLLRGPDPRAALGALSPERGWRIDIDPVSVL
ncbi:MAG: primosomal protein N' [Chloroflexota bacterium]|nr:primosomal protein N' [Chloroflexota bacterium]